MKRLLTILLLLFSAFVSQGQKIQKINQWVAYNSIGGDSMLTVPKVMFVRKNDSAYAQLALVSGTLKAFDKSISPSWFDIMPVNAETDPVFSASVAYGITAEDYDNWNLAHDKRPDSVTVTGTTTKTLRIYTQDGQDFVVTWTDMQGTTDTTSLSNRINLKQNISDTNTVDATRSWVQSQKYRVAYDAAALTDAGTITWDFSTGNEKNVTIGGNRTLSITNLPTDRISYGTLRVIQDATGSRTLTLPAGSKVGNNGTGAVTLSTAGGSVDILVFRYSPSLSTFWWVYQKNFN